MDKITTCNMKPSPNPGFMRFDSPRKFSEVYEDFLKAMATMVVGDEPHPVKDTVEWIILEAKPYLDCPQFRIAVAGMPGRNEARVIRVLFESDDSSWISFAAIKHFSSRDYETALIRRIEELFN